MPSPTGNDLNLGILAGGKASLTLSRTERDKHLYVCGGTGTGKSKFRPPDLGPVKMSAFW